jgi:lantibiotic modifying enzyme
MKQAVAILLLIGAGAFQEANRPYLEGAIQAARWLDSVAVRTPRGTAWPMDPREAKTIRIDLYSGSPGVVLFFLEAYASTGNHSYLDTARSGAEYLVSSMAQEKVMGLYEGIGGIGFTLLETYKATSDKKFLQAARRCLDWIRERAIKRGAGIEWSDTTDIISGSAGTGLFLLYAARELNDSAFRDLASAAGRRLLELGQQENGGLKWTMSPTSPSLMPNFSHGTSGIAYFLATLYQDTKDPSFLKGALAGAKYLQSIAETEGETCLVFHDEPGGRHLFYLGWCHGPPGTGRLFFRLHQVTGDDVWMDWLNRSARSLLQSGIPEKQTPGFWNNVGQCCGSAGVAEFALSVFGVTRKTEYLEFARNMTADLLARSTHDETGTRWVQAEHRVRPELLLAQTGLMQGSAGIGLWLLHMDNFEHGKKSRIILPDSPFQ